MINIRQKDKIIHFKERMVYRKIDRQKDRQKDTKKDSYREILKYPSKSFNNKMYDKF